MCIWSKQSCILVSVGGGTVYLAVIISLLRWQLRWTPFVHIQEWDQRGLSLYASCRVTGGIGTRQLFEDWSMHKEKWQGRDTWPKFKKMWLFTTGRLVIDMNNDRLSIIHWIANSMLWNFMDQNWEHRYPSANNSSFHLSVWCKAASTSDETSYYCKHIKKLVVVKQLLLHEGRWKSSFVRFVSKRTDFPISLYYFNDIDVCQRSS